MTRPLRIALASDWYLPRLGGIELHLADLARALRARGHVVHVVTSTPGDGDARDEDVRRLRGARLPGSGVAVSPALPRRLREAIADGAYDVVHAHASVVSPVAYGAVLAARRAGIPAVVTFHSVLHASARVLRLADLALGWRRWRVHASAVSAHVAAQLRRAMPGLPVEVLPDGIDAAWWRAAPRGHVTEGVQVVSAMRLHRKKRPAALLRAFHAARELAPGAGLRLTIFGDGPERHALERLRRSLGLDDCVTLAGARARAELRDAYAAADFFALPTVREAFGIAALEALAAGLPVVAMRGSGVEDFLVHERNALLCADDAELAGHLARLAGDGWLRRALAERAGDAEAYDWSVAAARHLDCYRRALGEEDSATTTAGAADGRSWRTVSSR